MVLKKSAIVVVVDRLGAGFVGPYGNTWIDTPNFNRLAAQSVLFENAIVDSPNLAQGYRSYLRGMHAACEMPAADFESLGTLAANNGIQTCLITDEAELGELESIDGFTDVSLVPTTESNTAESIDETQLARTFAAALDRIQTCRPPFLFWLHARGMQGPWDAPYQLRSQFADEEDPTTPDFVDPPSLKLDQDYDPDDLLGITHSYAGQIVACDDCLGAMLDEVERAGWDDDLLVVFTSPRGYPLGEHRIVGQFDKALYGELLHVPMIVRNPAADFAAQRSQALVHSPDLFATLCDWFELSSSIDPIMASSLLSIAREPFAPVRDRLCSISENDQSIRTPAWFMRRQSDLRQLFVKPDDRWEFNEVSDRCWDVVEELGSALNEFIQASQTNDFSSLSPLSENLLHGHD